MPLSALIRAICGYRLQKISLDQTRQPRTLIPSMKFIIPLILLLTVSAQAETHPEWQTAFCKALKTAATADHSKHLIPGEVYDSLGAATKASDVTESGNPIVSLWLSGETEDVELLWWRQSDRPTRVLTVALFSCIAKEPVAGIPPFATYAEHFNEKDAAQRREEIAFVKEHLSAIAVVLSKMTLGVERAHLSHDGYAAVAKAQIGSPLPPATTSRKHRKKE